MRERLAENKKFIWLTSWLPFVSQLCLLGCSASLSLYIGKNRKTSHYTKLVHYSFAKIHRVLKHRKPYFAITLLSQTIVAVHLWNYILCAFAIFFKNKIWIHFFFSAAKYSFCLSFSCHRIVFAYEIVNYSIPISPQYPWHNISK